METSIVEIRNPEGLNIIIGQTHFIKSVEDIYEAIICTNPSTKFGLAFLEASGPCLIRTEGTDDSLTELARENAELLSTGHVFILFLGDIYPINILNQIKQIPEVCHIYCATANPLQVIVARTEQGAGILGVIDGFYPKGVESQEDIKNRQDFLRKIGYKF